jgi:hypothetical protein
LGERRPSLEDVTPPDDPPPSDRLRWCHGFDPALHEFAATNADRIELRVLSGGLFTGSRALPMSAHPHIPGANERVTELTGVTFGDGHRAAPADGTVVMDSADAATGLVTLRRQPGEGSTSWTRIAPTGSGTPALAAPSVSKAPWLPWPAAQRPERRPSAHRAHIRRPPSAVRSMQRARERSIRLNHAFLLRT